MLGSIGAYLTSRKQRVVIDGWYSTWKESKARVPQGSVLGPFLFLVFINDITNNIKSYIKLFADDTMIFIVVEDPTQAAQILNDDLQTIHQWSETWLVKFNAKKTKSLLFGSKSNRHPHPKLYLNHQEISEVENHMHLGITLSSNGKWDEHISNIIAKTNFKLTVFRKLKYSLDRKSLERIYFAYIRPTLEYANIVWNNCTEAQKDKLEQLQLEAARIVTGSVRGTQHKYLYSEKGWLTLADRQINNQLGLMYKMVNDLAPQYLSLQVSRPGACCIKRSPSQDLPCGLRDKLLRQLHKGSGKLFHNFEFCGLSATGFTFSDNVRYLKGYQQVPTHLNVCNNQFLKHL